VVTSELLNYLKGQVTSGQKPEVIKNNLFKQGWSEMDINNAFSQIGIGQTIQIIQGGGKTITRSQADKFLINGFVVWVAGNILRAMYSQPNPLFFLGYLIFIIGYGTFIYGCMLYAKSKGYNRWLGLFGLLNLLGLVVLAIFPNKLKTK
jgi:hypothetical protein